MNECFVRTIPLLRSECSGLLQRAKSEPPLRAKRQCDLRILTGCVELHRYICQGPHRERVNDLIGKIEPARPIRT